MKELIFLTVVIAVIGAIGAAGFALLDHINEKGEAEDEARQFEDAKYRVHHSEQLYLEL